MMVRGGLRHAIRRCGLRTVATILDTILLLVVGYVMAMAIGGTSAEGFHLEGGPFFLWTLIACWIRSNEG
jgi:hypothetical protein